MEYSLMLARIWHIIIKEFIQLSRDRLLTLFLFTFPAMQLVLMAQATGSGATNLSTAILDQDHSHTSRGLTQTLDNTEELVLCYFPADEGEVAHLLDSGQANLAVVIPPDFERDLFDPNASPQVQIIADGSNSMAGNVGLGTAEGVIKDYLYRLMAEKGTSSASGTVPRLELRPTVRFNQTLDGRKYAIPSQVAFIVYQVTLAVAALTLARERELGTLEQLSVTPLRRFELLTGKAIPSAIIGLIDFTIMLFIIVNAYTIPMRGSWGLLFALTTLFVAVEVSWGMMISSISRTQQQAVLFVFLLAMTDVTLSGYLVPVDRMPLGLKAVSIFSPIRHYMTILRSIMLKGADLSTLWPEALALLVLGAGMAYLSIRNVAQAFE
jgi:ABC-2 type transport system permease protein